MFSEIFHALGDSVLYITESPFRSVYYFTFILCSIFLLGVRSTGFSTYLKVIIWYTFVHNWLQLVLIFSGVLHSNKEIYHVTVFIEFILFYLLYQREIKTTLFRRIMHFAAVFYIIFQLINSIWIQKMGAYNSNGIIIQETIFVLYALLLFSEMRDQLKYQNLLREGIFWFNTMVLLFNTFQVFIWGFQGYAQTPHWWFDISKILSALLYFVFALAVYLDYLAHRRKTKA